MAQHKAPKKASKIWRAFEKAESAVNKTLSATDRLGRK